VAQAVKLAASSRGSSLGTVFVGVEGILGFLCCASALLLESAGFAVGIGRLGGIADLGEIDAVRAAVEPRRSGQRQAGGGHAGSEWDRDHAHTFPPAFSKAATRAEMRRSGCPYPAPGKLAHSDRHFDMAVWIRPACTSSSAPH
jgi:hypothetical protein